MYKDGFYPSGGTGQIHYGCWEPEGQPKAVVQIVHGIAEHIQRYDAFARYLNFLGCLVVAEDHMGHGQSVGETGIQGYFYGGWFQAVEDTYQLLVQTRNAFADIPYILFGHSMGSFMARTILEVHPDSGISACIICGTGWMPEAVLKAGIVMCKGVCKLYGETKPNAALQSVVFGSYNRRIEHPRTAYDWLTRDAKIVDAYIADPMCGFTVTAGLLRDMLTGILYIQNAKNLEKMEKFLPVHFIAGGDDPVGNYSSGVLKAAEAFKQVGLQDISCRIYPLCRHEILNEINKQEIYEDIGQWIQGIIAK